MWLQNLFLTKQLNSAYGRGEKEKLMTWLHLVRCKVQLRPEFCVLNAHEAVTFICPHIVKRTLIPPCHNCVHYYVLNITRELEGEAIIADFKSFHEISTAADRPVHHTHVSRQKATIFIQLWANYLQNLTVYNGWYILKETKRDLFKD